MTAQHAVRIVPTERGPMLELSPDVALKVAGLVGRFYDMSPGAGPDADLREVRKLAQLAHRIGVEGLPGFDPPARGSELGTDEPPRVVKWLTAEEAAERLGISARAMTKRCQRPGRVPGAEFRAGRWFIPETSVGA